MYPNVLTSLLRSTCHKRVSSLLRYPKSITHFKTFATGSIIVKKRERERKLTLCIDAKDFTIPKTRNIGIIAHIDAGILVHFSF